MVAPPVVRPRRLSRPAPRTRKRGDTRHQQPLLSYLPTTQWSTGHVYQRDRVVDDDVLQPDLRSESRLMIVPKKRSPWAGDIFRPHSSPSTANFIGTSKWWVRPFRSFLSSPRSLLRRSFL